MGKLRVVHISDLHLFVESDGSTRSIAELNLIAAWARRHPNLPLLGGFNVHEGKALTALRKSITDIVENSAIPVLIVQSGDVSTFGARMNKGVPGSFPEWEFWKAERTRARAKQPVEWVDLYGNHDVWPGTLPAAAAHRVEVARNELRRLHYSVQIPQRVEIPVGSDRVEVYTLNTVQHTAIANTFAEGEVAFDHPDLTAPTTYPDGTTDPLDHISQLARCHRPGDPTIRVFRLLVMHHPPIFFGPSPRSTGTWARFTSGALRNEATLLRWLEAQDACDISQHLVLAGHRHLIDPQRGAVPPPIGRSCAVQVVCGTPTQVRGSNDPMHSFSVYDISFDANVNVTRTIYERPATARDFQPAGGSLRLI